MHFLQNSEVYIKLHHFRLTAGIDDCLCFNTYFLTQLLYQDGPDRFKAWSVRRNLTLFEKRMLIFPFHAANHWSLFVIVNPGRIQEAYLGKRPYKAMPFILHFDSLGSNSPHNKASVGRSLRSWLNRAWQQESANEYETAMPFSRNTLQIHRVLGMSFLNRAHLFTDRSSC